MPPERWKQIEGLFHSAMERPLDKRDAFLAEACRGDQDLHRQVARLIHQDGATQTLPPLTGFPEAAAHMRLEPGTTLGPYRITNRLGEGGMGQVYRALDTRLKRPVAVKISSEAFSRRFEREARLISSLNHPNICTLYDIRNTAIG